MAHSSLLGSDEVPVVPPGHDVGSLGPSDSSDSGSDLAGVAGSDEADPGLPVDVAAEAEREHPTTTSESVRPGADSDAEGTGERRSAGGDAGLREAADIGPDDVVRRPGGDVDVEEGPMFEDYPEINELDEDLTEEGDSGEAGAEPARKPKTPHG